MAIKFKRTKIIASLGPASSDQKTVDRLVREGVNGARLNFSHGTHESHKQSILMARSAAKDAGKPVAVIVDLQGPKIRVGQLPEEGVRLVAGQKVAFAHGVDFADEGIIPIQHDLSDKVSAGEAMYLFDGKLEVEIDSVDGKTIHTEVVHGGKLSSRKGINLPDTDLGGDILTTKDYSDIGFAIENDADYIAMSFVQRAEDVENLREYLRKHESDIKLIAKVETKAAAENIESIVAASDGVMVARGDLAIEVSPEVVPVLQLKIINLCKEYGKISIVATQMLASMVDSSQPTRAEVSDIATAITMGADSVMLSDETAVGSYPVEAVALMKRVILYTEANVPVDPLFMKRNDDSQGSSIASAAITLAHQIKAEAIVASTASGRTARNIASHRPQMPIIMATSNLRVAQQLAIVYGGKSYYSKVAKKAGEKAIASLHKYGQLHAGDVVVLTYGENPGVAGGTDTIKVREV